MADAQSLSDHRVELSFSPGQNNLRTLHMPCPSGRGRATDMGDGLPCIVWTLFPGRFTRGDVKLPLGLRVSASKVDYLSAFGYKAGTHLNKEAVCRI